MTAKFITNKVKVFQSIFKTNSKNWSRKLIYLNNHIIRDMAYFQNKYKMNKKTITLLISILFLTVSINQNNASSESSGDPINLSYGFIATSVRSENATIDNQIFCKIRHLVNDLLRENISVYWTINNITANITDISLNNRVDMFFEKGTFMIPFTGNEEKDTKLIAMIYDYNQTSEIDTQGNVEVYLLLKPLELSVYELSDVKIAQYHGIITGGEEHFLQNARYCGFLDFDFLTKETVKNKLDKISYNVLVWGGGIAGYSSFHNGVSASTYQIREDIIYKVAKTIRKFVSNGGGYIGSCLGAVRASSGMYFGNIPIYMKKRAYNPDLNTLGILALSDLLCKTNSNMTVQEIEVKIVNQTHPVTYGLEEINPDVYAGGPHFVRWGKNAQIIARFHDINDNLNKTPSWISSKFGDGNVMLFSTHPESLCWREEIKKLIGNTIISNAFYYTTSVENNNFNTLNSVNFSFIANVWEKTADLADDIDKVDVLKNIKIRINQTISNNTHLIENLTSAIDIIRDINKNITNNFLGYDSIYEVIFYIDLFNTYLENTTKTLEILEKIYLIIENEENFIRDFNSLKADLSKKINDSQDICSECHRLCIQYKNILNRYKQSQNLPIRIGSNIWRFLAKNTAFNIYKESVKGYHYAPQTYFNSLKFLRHHWYNYEANIKL